MDYIITAFGIITGTHENPKVKVLSKSGQEVEETEYVEKKESSVATDNLWQKQRNQLHRKIMPLRE